MQRSPLNGYFLKDEAIARIEALGKGTDLRPKGAKLPPPVDIDEAPKPTETKPGYREKQRARVLDDELGEYIAMHSEMFENKRWARFVEDVRRRGDLEPKEEALDHPAGKNLIKHLAKRGAPAIMATPPWGESEIEYRLKRGSHGSCDDHLDFLRGEMLEFVKKGFWTVLPRRILLQRLREKLRELRDLRLSPMGIIPQRERRPRLIVDYTFYEVNQDTLKLAPEEAMQFGRALERILYQVRHANPRYGPVYIGKVDLADGFYRVWLTADAIPKLAVAFPRYEGEEQMIALPLVLPMGWVESVPYFCACTETVADLSNSIPEHVDPGPHPLEEAAMTPPVSEAGAPRALPVTAPVSVNADPRESDEDVGPTAPTVLRPFHKPVASTDVYVDDFIQCVQGPESARMRHLRRLLHSIDKVFRPLDAADSEFRQHVPSMKKFLKGDAFLSTRKVVLGWIIDTLRGTLELPPHRQARLAEIFEYLRGRHRVGLSKWRKFLGELRSMCLGIPGSKGLFSALQESLKFSDQDRIRITPAARDQLLDFEHLANDLAARPTAIAELVPDHPVAVGPHDASGRGMGGVWLPATTHSHLTPILWREHFPGDIVSDLVSWENPRGRINNSQLELAGGIAHQDVLLQEVDCSGRTIAPLGDNTPAGVWHHKGSTSTTGPTAHLLGINSMHQRHYRYLAKESYISGPANQMADDTSRLWHLDDSQLLAHFNSNYPQTQSWRLVHLRREMSSALVSALRGQRPVPASYLGARAPRTATGAHGKSSLPLTKESTLTSSPIAPGSGFLFSKYSLRLSGQATSRQAVDLSGVDKWRTTFGRSARRSPWWMTKA